mmetsp:Transcript_34377/g.55148  ORF Transcript_34377/g.55148 Transcript_34377/m.55148 type:complete len:572 (-) Transcript_34377:88-1803(-)
MDTSNKEYRLLSLSYFSLSITNDRLTMRYCDDHIETYAVQPDTEYHLSIHIEESVFEMKINSDKIYQAVCHSKIRSFHGLLQFENAIHDTATGNVQIWSIHGDDHLDHRHLLSNKLDVDVIDVDDSFNISTTFDLDFDHSIWSSFDLSTTLLDDIEEYAWFEFWKIGWWNSDHWPAPKIVTAILVLLVIIAIVICPIVCYVKSGNTNKTKSRGQGKGKDKGKGKSEKRQKPANKASSGGIVLSPKTYASRYNRVENTDTETDQDEDVGHAAATPATTAQQPMIPQTVPNAKKANDIEMGVTPFTLSTGEQTLIQNNDDEEKEEEKKSFVPQDTPNDEDAAPDTVSDMNISTMSPGMFSTYLPKPAEHKHAEEGDEDNDSDEEHSDSEELYRPAEDTQAGTAGAVGSAYPTGRGSMQSTHSGSTGITTLVDKQSIKSGMRAAEMTVGHNDDAGNHVMLKAWSDDVVINMKESLETEDNGEGGGGEGMVWDNWLKDTLQECFPDDWQSYLARFKQQRITEDVLLSLNADKQNKSDVWKELIPIIGDRIRFQKAWEDELMRRQLNYDVNTKHVT